MASAEASGLDAASADLLTVAQALHWFDIPAFFAEAIRVLKPGGVLAIWSYHRARVNPECDRFLESILAEVEAFWPPERALVENRYRDIVLPVPDIDAPPFDMTTSWHAENMLDYVRTWSASQRYLAAKGTDPAAGFASELQKCWGSGQRDVNWPLIMKLCRKPPG